LEVIMPTADHILSWATAVANDWRWLAIAWHVALAALLMMCVTPRRPSTRLLGFLLAAPPASVAAVAWASGNLFNGVFFSVLVAWLLRTAVRLPTAPVIWAVPWSRTAGGALLAFGWAYPHFLRADTWLAYAYASPFGLLPCPTLAVVIGLTLMFSTFHSANWSLLVSGAGVLYGLIGVFVLGVAVDVWLLAGATLLAVVAGVERIAGRVRATDDERRRWLSGDELIRNAAGVLTHAITIGAVSEAVWPWVVQMGAGSRAGWYSYDFLDNGRRPSARRIVPELQQIAPGTLFPAIPGATEGFFVLGVEPRRSLVLGFPGPEGDPTVTWAFVLDSHAATTRLIVRVRAAQSYRFHRLPAWLSEPSIRLAHFVMQRKQLLEIAWRAERSSRTFSRRDYSPRIEGNFARSGR
jgi:hypothetical protein